MHVYTWRTALGEMCLHSGTLLHYFSLLIYNNFVSSQPVKASVSGYITNPKLVVAVDFKAEFQSVPGVVHASVATSSRH